MAETNEQDLWPGTFGPADEVSPMGILREQAALLASKTNKLVRAEVEDTTLYRDGDAFGPKLSARFVLVAPALGGYRYILFQISYPVVLYPVEISNMPAPPYSREARSSDEFRALLPEIFKASETQRIISSMMSESMARKGA
jgi:hypothetical protein